MPFVNPAYVCEHKPVYVINLVDDCTAVCPQCKAIRTHVQRTQTQRPPLHAVVNVIGHLMKPGGCNKDGQEKRAFDRTGYVQFGDLPMIKIADYQTELPFQRLDEPIAAGVAKILASEMMQEEERRRDQQNAQERRLTAQGQQLDIVWDQKVQCNGALSFTAGTHDMHRLQEKLEDDLKRLKGKIDAVAEETKRCKDAMTAKDERLRVVGNELLVKKAEITRISQDAEAQTLELTKAEDALEVAKQERLENRKRTLGEMTECAEGLQKVAKMFQDKAMHYR